MPKVVASWQTNLSLQLTSAQWTNFDLMAVFQRMAKLRVVVRPQAVLSPIAKTCSPTVAKIPKRKRICNRHTNWKGGWNHIWGIS